MTQLYVAPPPPDPFFYGTCPVKNWKKVRKRYEKHHFVVLAPEQIGTFMNFKYISTKDFMELIQEVFNQEDTE